MLGATILQLQCFVNDRKTRKCSQLYSDIAWYVNQGNG